jgi:uncharacterized protein YjbI with pentapeptide repeats
VSGQDHGQIYLKAPCPNRVVQRIHWAQQGQPWRTEPEIDAERQKYLEERRHRGSEERRFVLPLKNIPLSRADIEWLLATHDNGCGPVNWNGLGQRERKGLDLYRADLRGADLSELPLANSDLSGAHLEKANIYGAHLEGANLAYAHLEEVNLSGTHLENAVLVDAHLENANLQSAHLEGTKLMDAHLEGAHLASSYLDTETDLHNIRLFNQKMGGVVLADVRWGDVNLAVADWSVLSILGDERIAQQLRASDGTPESTLVELLKRATRAYRQLAIVLRNQGLSEDGARFAYRAQLMRQVILREQRKHGQYLFSLFLDLLAGYGFKPWRSFVAYLIVIATFAAAYFIIGHTVGPVLSPLGSVVFSMTSFHGRGFFPGGIGLDDPLTVVAALEAFVGLLIEVTFIATLTQRLFGK